MAQLHLQKRNWIDNTTYEPDEIAARFHHRLVWIHPYPNGNGRHARLATDLFLVSLGRTRFSWGRVNLVDAGETRNDYIAALRAADKLRLVGHKSGTWNVTLVNVISYKLLI